MNAITKTVAELVKGELLLVNAKKVGGNKVQLEFAQIVETGESRPQSILSLLNASDDRFNTSSSASRAWISGEAVDIERNFGLDLSSLENEGDMIEFNLLNPRIVGMENIPLNIQITETTKGSKYQIENIEKSAKRAGKDGDYITTKDGEFIFRNATVVTGEPSHVIFKETLRNTPSLTSEIADVLGK